MNDDTRAADNTVAAQIEEAAAHAEALRAGTAEPTKPGFRPDHPMEQFEGGDGEDDPEFDEPDESLLRDVEGIEGVKAKVATITFTGTDKGGDFDQVVRNLIAIGERLGLFYLSACSSDLPEEYIQDGSLLHQQLTGRQ